MEISVGRRNQRALLNYAVKNKMLAENAGDIAEFYINPTKVAELYINPTKMNGITNTRELELIILLYVQ